MFRDEKTRVDRACQKFTSPFAADFRCTGCFCEGLKYSSWRDKKKLAKGTIAKMIMHDVCARRDWSLDRSAEKGRILGDGERGT